jgi:ribosomal protein L29
MAKEIQEKNEKDLVKELSEKQEALRTFRFGISGSKVRNVREGRATRKEIARIKTELSRRAQ